MREAHPLVYLGLGGNFLTSPQALTRALSALEQTPEITGLKVSKFYQTTAVTQTPQADYTNAVCAFYYSLDPYSLLHHCASIEQSLGQRKKSKDAPRLIDIDILFFGEEWIQDELLQIPHPRWRERAFVIEPLLDLIETIRIPISHDQCEVISLNTLIPTPIS